MAFFPVIVRQPGTSAQVAAGSVLVAISEGGEGLVHEVMRAVLTSPAERLQRPTGDQLHTAEAPIAFLGEDLLGDPAGVCIHENEPTAGARRRRPGRLP